MPEEGVASHAPAAVRMRMARYAGPQSPFLRSETPYERAGRPFGLLCGELRGKGARPPATAQRRHVSGTCP